MANRKLGNVGKLGKLGIFFPSFLLPSFRFWVLGQNRKVRREKVGNKIPSFPSFPRLPSFRSGHLDYGLEEKSVEIIWRIIVHAVSIFLFIFLKLYIQDRNFHVVDCFLNLFRMGLYESGHRWGCGGGGQKGSLF